MQCKKLKPVGLSVGMPSLENCLRGTGTGTMCSRERERERELQFSEHGSVLTFYLLMSVAHVKNT
jgi:hypothetical protein